jgi:hypothetical protein
LKLFQVFLPVWLVEKWVRYTNEAAAPEPEEERSCGSHRGRRGPKSRGSHQNHWKSTSVAEIYIWIGILIYMTLHKESRYEDYWKVDEFLPEHRITQYMTFDRFFLLKRRLRTYDPGCIEVGAPDPFNKVNEWSNHMMEAAIQLVEIGSIIGVDEAIVGFKGRSRHKITIKTKPTPTGLKVWVLAVRGYLLRWYFHQPGPKYGPVGVEAALQALSNRASNNKPSNGPSTNELSNGPLLSDEMSDSSSDNSSDDISYDESSEDDADEGSIDNELLDEPSEEIKGQLLKGLPVQELPHLNPTQAVVVALVSKLPHDIYHVFLDNLFSSPDLFKALRILGTGATGTCRTNCGLYRDIVIAKENDRKGKGLWPWGRLETWPTPDNKVGRSSGSGALGNLAPRNALLTGF